MEQIEFIGIEGVMKITGVGRPLAQRYARECGLALPREKTGPWKIPKKAFIEWVNGKKN